MVRIPVVRATLSGHDSQGVGRNEAFGQPSRAVKHGDLAPGRGGQSRGAARAGGEIFAERDAQGNPTGRWIMDNDSSYTFARTDRTTLGSRELEAAHELLGRTGRDTANIVPGNTSGEGAPAAQPQPPAEVPPPVVRPVGGRDDREGR